MILAELGQDTPYEALHPRFATAIEFLRSPDLVGIPDGRYEVEAGEVTAIVVRGTGKPRSEARLEAHRRFIDIQYVISGDEEMGWSPLSECFGVTEPYDDSNDIVFFSDRPQSWFRVPPGSFAIFFPPDAHAPLVSDGQVHKVIMKVRV
jgi:YhcH/YjgK/YiaL family protein